MSSIVLGVPVLNRYDLLARLLASAERSSVVPDLVIVVDNGGRFDGNTTLPLLVIAPGRNIGVAASWNTIIERARALDAKRIMISNDDIELDPSTIARVLAEDADVVRAPGFAFFAMRPSVVDRVGWFDEQFFPAYFDDNDFDRRLRLAGVNIEDPQGVPIHHEGSATLHSLPMEKQHKFSRRFEELRAYYEQKWGGWPGKEKFDRAFDGAPPHGWSERPITVGRQVPEDRWFG